VAEAIQLALVDLVSRARRGDGTAFEELIRRYERLALGLAYAILQDAPSAGDIVQEAFLKAWRRLDALSNAEHFSAWLCGIVRNLCVDETRRRRPTLCGIEAAHSEADGRTPGPGEEMGRQELNQRVAAALQGLDETTRSVVVMRYYEDLSSREIGELLGLSAAAVDMRLMRGRHALKEKLAVEVNEI
jgi:RNA polymerase sigma-70 factor (ECF subfamily)